MKIRFPFLALLMSIIVFISCQQKENLNLVKISGQIINPTSDSVMFELRQSYESTVLSKGKLDQDGRFSLEFTIDKPSIITFNDMNEVSSFFVKPGSVMNLSVNTEMFDETMSFEGDLAKENNFFMKSFLMFRDFQSEEFVDFYSISQTMDPEEYNEFVENEMDKRISFFNEEDKVTTFDKDFSEYFSNQLALSIPSTKLYVFYGYRPGDTAQSVVNTKLAIANEIIEAKNMVLEQYPEAGQMIVKNAIPTALRYIVRNENIEKEQFDSVYYHRLSEILSEDELNQNIYSAMKSSLESYNPDVYNSKKDIIEKYLTNNTLRKELDSLNIELNNKLASGYAKGLNKINFGIEGMEDKTFLDLLAPYKGKVIYLDIWASWCGPCKAELPYSHELKEKMKGEEVAFIYLSTDRNQQAWENMLIMMELEGEHYRANKNINDYLRSEFDLQFIPHYIIFDQEGKLVKNNASRPSSDEIEGELRALL